MLGYFISKNLINFFGLLLPAYQTYKCLNQKQDERRLLKYWVVIAMFLFLEFYMDIIVSFLPLYYEFKLLFVAWLIIPQTKGATVIYTQYLKPYLKEKEPLIDAKIAEARELVLAKLHEKKRLALIYAKQKRNLIGLHSLISSATQSVVEERSTAQNQLIPISQPVQQQQVKEIADSNTSTVTVEEVPEEPSVESSSAEADIESPTRESQLEPVLTDIENISPPNSPSSNPTSSPDRSSANRLNDVTNISPTTKARHIERTRKQQGQGSYSGATNPRVIRSTRAKQLLESMQSDKRLAKDVGKLKVQNTRATQLNRKPVNQVTASKPKQL